MQVGACSLHLKASHRPGLSSMAVVPCSECAEKPDSAPSKHALVFHAHDQTLSTGKDTRLTSMLRGCEGEEA